MAAAAAGGLAEREGSTSRSASAAWEGQFEGCRWHRPASVELAVPTGRVSTSDVPVSRSSTFQTSAAVRMVVYRYAIEKEERISDRSRGAALDCRPSLRGRRDHGSQSGRPRSSRVAPAKVSNLLLWQTRAFDGLVAHRVIPDFVVQVGDPTGNGWGGPADDPGRVLISSSGPRGWAGVADSAGSQWFITHSQPYLDRYYTLFGQVIRGWEVLDGLGDRIESITVHLWRHSRRSPQESELHELDLRGKTATWGRPPRSRGCFGLRLPGASVWITGRRRIL